MKPYTRPSQMRWLVLVSLLIVACLVSPSSAVQVALAKDELELPRNEATPQPADEIPPIPVPVDPDLAFRSTLDAYTERIAPGKTFELNEIHSEGAWAYAVADEVDQAGNRVPYGFVVLLGHYEPDIGWRIVAPGINTASDYNTLLFKFPNQLIDESTKAFLYQLEPTDVTPLNFSGHKLPWPAGQEGQVTQKDGIGHTNQVDFDILGHAASGDVFASKPGTVVFVKESSNSNCEVPPPDSCWKKANVVVVQHSNGEYSWYFHLAYNSVPVSVGDTIGYGAKIGVEGNTGYATNVHLHYMASSAVPASWPDPGDPNDAPWPPAGSIIAVDFVEVSWASMLVNSRYVSQNGGGASCPQSGGVILYKHNNYDCGGEGEGSGYIIRASTGFQNVPGSFNDQASSLRVPSGWSVRLFEHSDRGGASVCRNADDNDFAGDYFDGGSVPLNDRVSSFEVFNNSNCGSGGGDTVTIYEHANFTGTQYGWHDPGLFNPPDYMDNRASSIWIAGGWSARVFENPNGTGGQKCYDSTDNDFSNDTFDNGHAVNDAVSSIEVYPQETCPAFVPPTPTNFRVSGTTYDSITLAWNDVNNETGYKIYRWGWDGSQWRFIYHASVGANVTTYTDTGLNCDTTYYYELSAYNGNGESAHAGWIAGKTQACPVDAYEPDNDASQAKWIYSGQPQTHSILPVGDVDWVKFSLNGPSGIVLETSGSEGDTVMWLYDSNLQEIEYDDDGGSNYFSRIDRICGVDALPAGTYYVKVGGFDNDETIPSYNLRLDTQGCPVPPTPTNFRVSSATQTSITLAWNDVSNETGYKIYRWGWDGSQWTFIYHASVGANITTYTDTGLVPGEDYYYELSAYNGNGESAHAGWIRGLTLDAYEPDNGSAQAKWIYTGQPQTHNITPVGDVDWVKFSLNGPSGIVLETTGPDNDDDTRMWLYDSSLVEIDYNDDKTESLFSLIDRVCGVDELPAGTYYVKIDEYGNNNEIPSYTISLTVNACGSTERLVNGSMEADTNGDKVPDYWKIKSPSGKSMRKCNQPAQGRYYAHTGTCAAVLQSTGAKEVLQQTYAPAGGGLAGDQYRLSLWAEGKSIPAGATARAVVTFKYADGTKGKFTLDLLTGTYAYQLFTLDVTAAKAYTAVKVKVEYTASGGELYVDDVSLVQTN